MKTKKVYCLKSREDDNSAWSEPDYFKTAAERNKAASIARIFGGFRTHSYEEFFPAEKAVELTS